MDRLNPEPILKLVGEDTLVLADTIIGEVKALLESGSKIVGIDDRDFARSFHTFRSHTENVGIGTDED
jgi:metallophosphoesterase superfamily enzyme